MRSYKSFTAKEKSEMYCAAQNKCCDTKIMTFFDCDEDTLLRCIDDVFMSLQQSRGFTGFNRYK